MFHSRHSSLSSPAETTSAEPADIGSADAQRMVLTGRCATRPTSFRRPARAAVFRPKRETENEMRLAADGGPIGHGSAADEMASPIAWRRSSRCSSNSCVEVGGLPDGSVAVRDSKSPDTTPVLVFATDEWTAFIAGVKAGEFG
jgi:hypothetical protein